MQTMGTVPWGFPARFRNVHIGTAFQTNDTGGQDEESVNGGEAGGR